MAIVQLYTSQAVEALHEAAEDSSHALAATEAPPSSEENLEKLLQREIVLHIASKERPQAITLHVRDFPQWVTSRSLFSVQWYSVSAAAIRESLEKGEIPTFVTPQDTTILSTERDSDGVLRAHTSNIGRSGYVYDANAIAGTIASAINDGELAATVNATYVHPSIVTNLPDIAPKKFELLATGISDLTHSVPERRWNVHKAFYERVHNVIVPPGETFSLIDALDTPVTLDKGWKESLGLFGGGAAPTVGGGICQSAVTLYRAALLAGLPIVEKKNHSLFVDYYGPFGIGLDATVFPGFHDLRFRNDTNSDIIFQSSIEGDTATIRFFGERDGRTVHLDGPYFAATPNRPKTLRALGIREVGWVRTITFGDGTQKVEPIISTYAKPLWRSLIEKYDGKDGMDMVTGKMKSEPIEA